MLPPRAPRLPRPRLLLTAVMLAAIAVSGLAAGSSTPAPVVAWSDGPSFPSDFTPRWDAAVAYHPPSQRVVLFGGSPSTVNGSWFNDTWMTTGLGSWWKGQPAPAGLTPRGGAAMAYHPPTGDLVMFGGAANEWPYKAETWLFDGTSWRPGPPTPAGMEGRIGAEMAYDPKIGSLVLHGGSGRIGYTDTWLYDARGWRRGPAPTPHMEPRAFFMMNYDARLDRIVIAGGSGDREGFLFNGSRWVNGFDLPQAMGAVERVDAEYDPRLRATVTFGGLGPMAQERLHALQTGGSWNESVKAWQQYWPSRRYDAELVWVDHMNSMLLVGGVHNGNDGRDIRTDTFWMNEQGA